jgi:hypothetical protein
VPSEPSVCSQEVSPGGNAGDLCAVIRYEENRDRVRVVAAKLGRDHLRVGYCICNRWKVFPVIVAVDDAIVVC